MITLHNVCAVHRGMFSTLAGIMSTVGDMSTDTMSTLGVFSTLGAYYDECGDIMSTLMDGQYTEGYHEYTGGLP